MGMYTEFFFRAEVRDCEVVDILRYMSGEVDIHGDLPDHEFFLSSRWDRLFLSSSHYFVPTSTCLFEKNEITGNYSLVVYSSLKNYDNEIKKFIDWIRPYLDCLSKEPLGWYRYEEICMPTIIYY